MKSVKNAFHLLEALVASVLYGFPSHRIKVIGVTGTDGKTTTAHLIYHILKQTDKKVSLISSIEAIIAGKKYETGFHTTTPRAWMIQKYLRQAVNAGNEFFVLETTSHALDQNRVWGVTYEVSIVTNITHEHLYHHKTFDEYLGAKVKLLEQSNICVLNCDDASFSSIIQIIEGRKFYTFGLKSKADFGWDQKIRTDLVGEYNKQNILAAYAVCKLLGASKEKIRQGIKTFTPPKGRLEVIYDKDTTVIIDFAHTPQSIASVLETIRRHFVKKGGRVIHIFGAASERDDAKRPLMGEASAQFSDVVILTEEDYRKEDVDEICRQIAEGLKRCRFKKISKEELVRTSTKKRYVVVSDRTSAIRLGIEIAQKGDVVVSTGKGHEGSLNRGGKEFPWDEYKAVRKALQQIYKS